VKDGAEGAAAAAATARSSARGKAAADNPHADRTRNRRNESRFVQRAR